MDRLLGYENVGHVLSVLSDMHEQIGQVLGELGHQAADERRKLNLEYLAEHQSRRATALVSYQQNAEPTLLEQWFQIPFPEEPSDLIASLQTRESDQLSIDSLICEIDTFMDRLLPHLRDRAETRNAKALFDDLMEIESRERHLQSRALASFAQI